MFQATRIQIQAAHPRVRYQAWRALLRFIIDQTEAVTGEVVASSFIPEFQKGLEDPCQRVVVASMQAFQSYGEQVEREDLEPFVDALMQKFAEKMQGSISVQKDAITFIADS